VIILSKLMMAISLVGLLRCSSRFRNMSRELDERAFAALERIMDASEESGYPRHLIPLLMLVTALSFMLSMYFTTAGAP
jgi:ABC-type dipeptide/oligopeptide/nickel transport system permease subunit